MAGKKRRNFFYRGTYFDYPSLFLVLFLFFFGLVMVMSVSSYQGRVDFDDSLYYFKRQLLFGTGGLAAMWFVSHMRYQFLKNWSLVICVGTILLLGLVYVVGSASHGSTRWINLGFISFQPSEIAKMSLIIYTAHICTARSGYLKTVLGAIVAMLLPMIAIVMIAIENLSTAIVCGVIVVTIWFVATPKKWHMLLVLGAAVAFFIIFLNMASYRGGRIDAWLHPETSADGYQTMQALYAIGSGGLFGRGLGQSIQKMGFIPEAHNDMVFSVVCEELGIVGGIMIILVFGMLLWRFRFIAEGAPDRFGALLVVGVIAHIAFQVILNICVVTNTLPNTGCALPFISYGGSSLAFLMVEMGIVFSVSRQIVPLSKTEGDAVVSKS
ncbi:MAG: cell division protein FtsW [Eubacterium sp.]|nr:cell division protein FtsW [Eubacterium sp.]